MRYALCCLAILSNLVFANQMPNQALLENQAKQKLQPFVKQLKQTLTGAVKQGGLSQGIKVCSQVANEFAQQHSTEGWTIARTALKYRNPENKPNAWLQQQLETLQKMKDTGVTTDKLVLSELVTTGSGNEFRMVKAIPTKKLCLNCHGENLSKQVQQTLTQLYPDDLATGFKLGDIRGAFLVTKTLP